MNPDVFQLFLFYPNALEGFFIAPDKMAVVGTDYASNFEKSKSWGIGGGWGHIAFALFICTCIHFLIHSFVTVFGR